MAELRALLRSHHQHGGELWSGRCRSAGPHGGRRQVLQQSDRPDGLWQV